MTLSWSGMVVAHLCIVMHVAYVTTLVSRLKMSYNKVYVWPPMTSLSA